jgi:hypothetical protein
MIRYCFQIGHDRLLKISFPFIIRSRHSLSFDTTEFESSHSIVRPVVHTWENSETRRSVVPLNNKDQFKIYYRFILSSCKRAAQL